NSMVEITPEPEKAEEKPEKKDESAKEPIKAKEEKKEEVKEKEPKKESVADKKEETEKEKKKESHGKDKKPDLSLKLLKDIDKEEHEIKDFLWKHFAWDMAKEFMYGMALGILIGLVLSKIFFTG
ncbi:hypothetical protein JXC34_04110, partial [Candidatus Woesearchaeota archaeon]|nr:hypothetical protein [Candidatus Woesearchaeota archaeon]